MEDFNINNLSKKEEVVNNKFRKYDDGEIYDMAIEFLKHFEFRTIRTDDEKKEMYKYNEDTGVYIQDGASYIRQMCAKSRMTATDKFVKPFTYQIQSNTVIDRENFVPPRHLVNMKNGVFSIETGKLSPHDSKYNFQTILNIIYDESAKCPTWEKALKGMLPVKEVYERTQKWFGYQFVTGNRDQIAHGYFGEAGSGKSTILMILRDLLGHQNVTSFQIQEFSNPNMYSIAKLYGKYANITYDMSTMRMKDISAFKSLTSGDPITGRNPHKEAITFVNEAKFTWGCNKLPFITQDILETDEFQRRIMLTKVIKGHKKEDIDKDIYKKFLEELPGIFNWASEGYRMYMEKGFEYEENIHETWTNNMDDGIRKSLKDENSKDIIPNIKTIRTTDELIKHFNS